MKTQNILGIEVKPVECLLSCPEYAKSIGLKYGFLRDENRVELCRTVQEAIDKIESYFPELFDYVEAIEESEATDKHPLIKWHTRELEDRGTGLHIYIGVDATGTEWVGDSYEWDDEAEIANIELR